jgi:hypothetical protein
MALLNIEAGGTEGTNMNKTDEKRTKNFILEPEQRMNS